MKEMQYVYLNKITFKSLSWRSFALCTSYQLGGQLENDARINLLIIIIIDF
jgi:hypothetical protein